MGSRIAALFAGYIPAVVVISTPKRRPRATDWTVTSVGIIATPPTSFETRAPRMIPTMLLARPSIPASRR